MLGAVLGIMKVGVPGAQAKKIGVITRIPHGVKMLGMLGTTMVPKCRMFEVIWTTKCGTRVIIVMLGEITQLEEVELQKKKDRGNGKTVVGIGQLPVVRVTSPHILSLRDPVLGGSLSMVVRRRGNTLHTILHGSKVQGFKEMKREHLTIGGKWRTQKSINDSRFTDKRWNLSQVKMTLSVLLHRV